MRSTQSSSYLQFRLKPACWALWETPFHPIQSVLYIGTGTIVEQKAVIKGRPWLGGEVP